MARWAGPLAALFDASLLALPPRLALGLADLVAEVAFVLARSRRLVALENLRLVFGARLDDRRRLALARDSFRHLARTPVELAFSRRLLQGRRARRARLRYPGTSGDILEAARHSGGVFVTAHLGNWEVAAAACRIGGLDPLPMARALGSPFAEALLARWRGTRPGRRLEKRGGLAGAQEHLRRKGWVAMLADQNAGRHGLFVPFFGVAASTFPTPVTLALRAEVPLWLGACLRRAGEPFTFDLFAERIDPEPEGAARDRVRATLRRLHGRLEALILRDPAQYHWLHRRFKLRPPGARPGAGEPAYGRFAEPPPSSRAAREARRAARSP
jgi:KDO2-lipid IV(A) lauroyltransferase